MHPGWADTPGVQSALPGFRRITQTVLRSSEEGADTIVWLARAREAADISGKLFLDREPRTTHLRKSTKEASGARANLLPWLRDTYAALSIDGSG
jgi:dehydrogenase/reductase SDR family protein 12